MYHTCGETSYIHISFIQSQSIDKVGRLYLIAIYMRSLRQYDAMFKSSWVLLSYRSVIPGFAN